MKHLDFEETPAAAADIFGSNLKLANAYASALARDSETFGLLGPRELPRLWSRHILNSAVVSELIPNSSRVADVGAGAGLPGIPIAIARPDIKMNLIEPMERRSEWLAAVVRELGLSNVNVIRARGEDVINLEIDVVVARAVAALAKLIGFTAPILRGQGEILAIKGEKVTDEMAEAKRVFGRFDIEGIDVVFAGEAVLEQPTRLARIRVGNHGRQQ